MLRNRTMGEKKNLEGKYVLVGVGTSYLTSGLYISKDYGLNFTKTSGIYYARTSAMSDDGKYIINGMVEEFHLSSDYGATWVRGYGGLLNRPTPVCISADGKYQFAIDRRSLFRSSDYGVTWEIISIVTGGTTPAAVSIAVSADGKYLIASMTNAGNYSSSDYGVTWSKTPYFYTSETLESVAISEDGKYQVAILRGNASTTFKSSDYGVTWSMVKVGPGPSGSTLYRIAMSRDGKYRTVTFRKSSGVDFPYVFRSEDYGVTWQGTVITLSTTSNYITDLAMSPSGKYQLVTGYDGIWVRSSDYGFSWYDLDRSYFGVDSVGANNQPNCVSTT